MKNSQIHGIGSRMARDGVLDHVTRAYEQEADAKAPGSNERSANDGVGRVVTAHGINGDAKHSCQLSAIGFS